MKIKTLGRSMERLFYLLFMLLGVASGVHAQGPAMTNVSDVVYRANGQVAAGTIVVSWPAFNTADNKPVAAGTLSIVIGAEGTVNFALVPNEGSDPGGTFYKAVYKLTDGTTFTEYWVVPSASPATVAAIRASVVPRQVGAQFVNRQYVDTAVATTHEQVVHRTGSEAIAGVKSFSASPEVPEPASGAAAVNKDYVTGAVSALSDGFVDKGGDTMTGPLTVPDTPVAPGHATSRQYVDLQVADIAAGLSAKLGRLNDTPINLAGVRYASQFATGESSSAQVSAACADLSGGQGMVFMPSAMLTGDITPALVNKCRVWDFRGTGTMNSNPPTYTTAYAGGTTLYERVTTSLSSPFSATQFNAYFDLYSGGINVLANKANYQQVNFISRAATPGQHTGVNATINKYSMGDAQSIVGIVDYASGNLAGIGDEGIVPGRFVARQLNAVFTATVQSVSGNEITYTAPAGEGFIGEGRYLVNKTSDVYTSGTASASGTTVTGSSTIWSAANLPGIGTAGNWVWSLDSEEIGVLKTAFPVASRSSDTSLTLQDPWSTFADATAGPYKLYKSSIITGVDPDNDTITVADGTRFTTGDVIELPNSNKPSIALVYASVDQKLAAPTAPVGYLARNNNAHPRGRFAQSFLSSGNSNVVLQHSSHTVAPNVFINSGTGPAPGILIQVSDNADTPSMVHTLFSRRAALGGTARFTYNNQNGGDAWQFGSNAITSLQVKTNVVAVGIGATVTANTALLVTPQSAGDKGIVINGSATGDLLDAQTAAVSRFKVAGDGAVTAAGAISAGGFFGPLTGSVTGNATTATTLQSARNINGISFNGSANITVTANLPANPAACGAGDFVTDIAADGTLTCAPATGGAAGFDAITSGTNTAAAMVVGTGGTLSASGSGTIAATTAAALAVNPADCAAKNFATTIAANGNLTCGRPPGQRDQQGPTTALVGDGTDQALYVTSLDANDLAAGHCYRVTASHHTGGTASTAFKYTLGTTTILTTTTGSIPVRRTTFYICNNAGVTNAQTTWVATYFFDNSVGHTLITPSPSTEDTTTALTLKLTFNVAGPNTATGNFWLVERL